MKKGIMALTILLVLLTVMVATNRDLNKVMYRLCLVGRELR
jgi:hypothetical protein